MFVQVQAEMQQTTPQFSSKTDPYSFSAWLVNCLRLAYPSDENVHKPCARVTRMHQNTVQTWQGCLKPLVSTVEMFAVVFVEARHFWSYSVFLNYNQFVRRWLVSTCPSSLSYLYLLGSSNVAFACDASMLTVVCVPDIGDQGRVRFV